MGGYMKNCTGERETAVVELADLGDDGGGTRPRMPAMASQSKEEESSSGKAEKRIRDAELDLDNSAFVELRSIRRKVVIEVPAESVPANGLPRCGPLTFLEERNCESEPASCSSSKTSIELVGIRSTIADLTMTQGQTESAQLETLTFSGGIQRTRASPLKESSVEESGSLESMAPARPLAEVKSRRKSTVMQMPWEFETEEFFSSAEKDIQKRFSERYNFDFVKGVPLEGRYEWVRERP